MSISVPKVSIFSGDPNGATSYDVWKYEIQCLLKENYPRISISEAIRRSLKGNAKKVVMCLGSNASIDEIILKLDSVYGNIRPQVDILQEFYSMFQGDKENVASWGCRLESVLKKARDAGDIAFTDYDSMLKERFWSGLRPSIKHVTYYEHDKCTTYNQLLVEIRKRENSILKSSEICEDRCTEDGIPVHTDDVNEMYHKVETISQMVNGLICKTTTQ